MGVGHLNASYRRWQDLVGNGPADLAGIGEIDYSFRTASAETVLANRVLGMESIRRSDTEIAAAGLIFTPELESSLRQSLNR